MFDIGWTELLLIGIVALIVVGPKDLPGMFHTLGRIVARAKGMAREFQNAMNEAAKEAGVDEVAADLKKATSAKSMGLDKLEEAATKFENWDPTASTTAKKAAKPAPLSKERAEVAEKIREATARTASDSQAQETAKSATGTTGKSPAAGKKTAAAKKTAAKKPAKKPVTRKTPARKTAAKKPAARKTAAGKSKS